MIFTHEILKRSVARKPFGTFEPFITGHAKLVASFYNRAFGSLEILPTVSMEREPDHHGSGYASYVSAFLFPKTDSESSLTPPRRKIEGLLVYMSRLAPIAVYGAGSRNLGSGGPGFITSKSLGTLPDGNWREFLATIQNCLGRHQIEMLAVPSLLHPAPIGLPITSVFPGPYYVFDTLFYWTDRVSLA